MGLSQGIERVSTEGWEDLGDLSVVGCERKFVPMKDRGKKKKKERQREALGTQVTIILGYLVF